MASARKCDRCGKLYEVYDVKCKKYETVATDRFNAVKLCRTVDDGYYRGKMLDLCPECMDGLLQFLSMKGEE